MRAGSVVALTLVGAGEGSAIVTVGRSFGEFIADSLAGIGEGETTLVERVGDCSLSLFDCLSASGVGVSEQPEVRTIARERSSKQARPIDAGVEPLTWRRLIKLNALKWVIKQSAGGC